MQINTEWYRIFLKVSQTENLTRAAEQLHMTQPSISYAIKQLEENLSIELFERLSKGVRLTQEGKVLAEYIEKAFYHIVVAENQIDLIKQNKVGIVRIGSNGGIIKDVVLPILDEFHEKYSEIRIRLLQAKTNEIIKHIKEGQLDVGFVYLPVNVSEVVVRPLKSIQSCFVVGPKFQYLADELITTERLTELPLLLLSSGSTTRRILEAWFATQGYKIKADIELNSVDMLVEFAKRGYGAAFVTKSFVQNELAQGNLFELNIEHPTPVQELGIVTRDKNSLITDILMGMYLESH
ncbi:LysR family transcriptional regulator [Paenibacillus sp. FSL R5-0519]|uniref:LysR family transcriptional regulator n=1 Tax=Paenibacillus sp. FSL R5-0519 TaxID=2921648 RepID=UPI0030DA1031